MKRSKYTISMYSGKILERNLIFKGNWFWSSRRDQDTDLVIYLPTGNKILSIGDYIIVDDYGNFYDNGNYLKEYV